MEMILKPGKSLCTFFTVSGNFSNIPELNRPLNIYPANGSILHEPLIFEMSMLLFLTTAVKADNNLVIPEPDKLISTQSSAIPFSRISNSASSISFLKRNPKDVTPFINTSRAFLLAAPTSVTSIT